MRTAKAAACALLMTGMFQAATAAEAEGAHWSLDVSGGSLGISPEIGYRFGAHSGVRVNGGFFDYDRTEEVDDISYDGTLKLNSIGALLDWYPFGGRFRISGGARSSKNGIELLATPTTSVQIGDQTYTPAQVGVLNGDVDFKDFVPQATLGWGGSFKSGFAVGLEVGVLFQGAPKFGLTASGGTLSTQPAFLAELEQERQQAEEDADDFKLWPVLQLHLMYRF